jgi:hypothetical protein
MRAGLGLRTEKQITQCSVTRSRFASPEKSAHRIEDTND